MGSNISQYFIGRLCVAYCTHFITCVLEVHSSSPDIAGICCQKALQPNHWRDIPLLLESSQKVKEHFH